MSDSNDVWSNSYSTSGQFVSEESQLPSLCANKLKRRRLSKSQKSLIQKVTVWSCGNKGTVDRTKAAVESMLEDDYQFICPVIRCIETFPRKECLELHIKNAEEKTHEKYRDWEGRPKVST